MKPVSRLLCYNRTPKVTKAGELQGSIEIHPIAAMARLGMEHFDAVHYQT